MENASLTEDRREPSQASSSNRQSRKLQLRKAGFKAKDVGHRNFTPSKSDSWSRANTSAALTSKRPSVSESEIKSAISELTSPPGILREIGNSSRRRKKQSRTKIDESIFVYQDENVVPSPKAVPIELESVAENGSRCGTPKTATKPRSSSKSTPVSRLRRQSVSIDTVKYIEHLESELAAMQTQLAAMTSPTVMQARSLKMRALNAETRALQDDLADWENKFHERVQEEIEERNKVETGLKARIRLLEGDAEDYSQKIKDMQTQLEKSVETINVTETANLELERRIDAISGLVASPKKRDLERMQESARRRHDRHKSLLPRFPTTGSLHMPSRINETPTTPSMAPPGLARSASVDRGVKRHPTTIEVNKEALDALTGGEETTKPRTPLEATGSASSSKRFSWATPDCYTSLDSVAASTGKPSRRMRRFHAGSVMPKPLLLPSTASYAYAVPSSAPPMEKEQTPPSFPFPDLPFMAEAASTRNFDFLLSPMPGNGRRRAMTCIEDVAAAMRQSSNPFVSPMPWLAAMAKGTKTSTTGPSLSDQTLADASSLGPPPIGRNLFDELQRAKDDTHSETSGGVTMERTDSNTSNLTERPSNIGSLRSDPWSSTTRNVGLRKRAWTSHQRTFSDQTGISAFNFPSKDANNDEDEEEESDHGFRAVFSHVWRQTYDTARQCMMYAHSVTLRSTTVQRLQWWLVQLLLGPMATRRMMAASMRQGRRKRQADRIRAIERSPVHHSGQSRALMSVERNVWLDGLTGREMRAVRRHRSHFGVVARTSWIERQSPWLWLRFFLALSFAIGAALRDGPGLVMGVEEEEDRIE